MKKTKSGYRIASLLNENMIGEKIDEESLQLYALVQKAIENLRIKLVTLEN